MSRYRKKKNLARSNDFDRSNASLPVVGAVRFDEPPPRMGEDRFTLSKTITGAYEIISPSDKTIRFSEEPTIVTGIPGTEFIDNEFEIPLDDEEEDDADETLRIKRDLPVIDIELEPVDDEWNADRKAQTEKTSTQQAAHTGTFWSGLQTAGNMTAIFGTIMIVLVSLGLAMSMLYSNTARTLSAVHQPVSSLHQVANNHNQIEQATMLAERAIETGISTGAEFSNVVASVPSAPSINNRTTLDDPEFTMVDLIPEHVLAQVDSPLPQPTTHVQPPPAIAESGPATSVVRTTGPKIVHSKAKQAQVEIKQPTRKITSPSTRHAVAKQQRKAKSPESLAVVQPPPAIAEPGPAHAQGEIQPTDFEEMPVIVTSANVSLFCDAHMEIHSENRHSHEIAFLQGF